MKFCRNYFQVILLFCDGCFHRHEGGPNGRMVLTRLKEKLITSTFSILFFPFLVYYKVEMLER